MPLLEDLENVVCNPALTGILGAGPPTDRSVGNSPEGVEGVIRDASNLGHAVGFFQTIARGLEAQVCGHSWLKPVMPT
jgi:hypothetical protein